MKCMNETMTPKEKSKNEPLVALAGFLKNAKAIEHFDVSSFLEGLFQLSTLAVQQQDDVRTALLQEIERYEQLSALEKIAQLKEHHETLKQIVKKPR